MLYNPSDYHLAAFLWFPSSGYYDHILILVVEAQQNG